MTSTGWSPLGFDIGPRDTPQRVFIALPVYSAIHPEFFASFLTTVSHLASKGIAARICPLPGDSLVTRARNNLAHIFLKETSIPFLLFLDTDLGLSPAGIEHLVSLPPEFAVVGGCYPKKVAGPVQWVFNPLPGTPTNTTLPETLEVWENGTGLMRIHRSVFGAIREAYPQYRYMCDGAGDERCDFFPVGTFPDPINKRTRYLSEDWAFCQLARAVGFKIWADTKCTARHFGQIAYPWPEPAAPAQPESAASPAVPGPGGTAGDGAAGSSSAPPPCTNNAPAPAAPAKSTGRGRTRRKAATSAGL